MEFARRADNINLSVIREILKLTQNKNVISFAGGLPNKNLFPLKKIRLSILKVVNNTNLFKSALQYSESAGLYELREEIAKTYKEKDNLKISPEQIIITTGSQQALDLIAKIYIDKNDTILTESPSYLAAIQTFQFYTRKIDSIPLTENGPNISKLPNKKIKLFYTVPNFQNPTGITWSNSIRKEVANWAKKNKTILIEDDPYGELRFEGERQKTLKQFNKDVILLGSFSKILAPGLRLGWIVAPTKQFFDKLLLAKQSSDLHSSTLTQYIALNYYKRFGNQKHIKLIAKEYKVKKDAMIKELEKHFKEHATFTNPRGGMFIWLEFNNKKINTEKLLQYAVKEGVAFVPGKPFYPKDAKINTLRLNYTCASLNDIRIGIKKLKIAYQKYLSSN